MLPEKYATQLLDIEYKSKRRKVVKEVLSDLCAVGLDTDKPHLVETLFKIACNGDDEEFISTCELLKEGVDSRRFNESNTGKKMANIKEKINKIKANQGSTMIKTAIKYAVTDKETNKKEEKEANHITLLNLCPVVYRDSDMELFEHDGKTIGWEERLAKLYEVNPAYKKED